MRVHMRGNFDDVLKGAKDMAGQYRFAGAVALTKTAGLAKDAMPDEVARALDRPTAFTKGGFFTSPARKDRLTATIGVKDIQAGYLEYQVEGGERSPKNVALRLPSVIQLDAAGNIPAGTIKKLVARALAGKRATRAQGKRFGVSTELDLFYGEPGEGRPAGLYKRVPIGGGATRLVPMIVFPKQAARYGRRFDFYGACDRVFEREFPTQLEAAERVALATAR